MTFTVGVRSNGGRHRFLCSCGAGDGVPGGKEDPRPVSEHWPHTSVLSARVAGKTHLATVHKQ